MRCKACNSIVQEGDYCEVCESLIFEAELNPFVEEFAFDPEYLRNNPDWTNLRLEE